MARLDEIDGEVDGRVLERSRQRKPWWLPLALLAVLGAVIFASVRVFPPGPMDYCKGLSTRGLVDDCADDKTPPPGAKSVTFRMTANKKVGHIMKFGNDRDYWAAYEPWKPVMAKAQGYAFGRGDFHVMSFIPGPIDIMTWEEFADFFSARRDNDFDAITRGDKPVWHGEARERPVHTDKCQQSPECSSEGRCTELRSHPEKGCLASYDVDCFASEGCKREMNCSANSFTWRCELHDFSAQ